MYLMRSALVALVGVVSAAPIAAQGIPRNSRQQTVTNAPRLMVANPFAFAAADSANAVKIGSAARAEMKAIVGRTFSVVEQTQMNDALKQYGYPTDAILTPQLAVTLAKNIQARVVLTGSMARAGERMSVTARLIGVNDEAGNVVSLTQAPGQSVEDFGKKLARALEPAVKALPDAKACVDQQTSKPDKAQDAANKAIRARPNHGLAEFCLAQIAKAQKKPAEVVKHLQAAVKGDPLSLSAWNSLAEHYQAVNDTANTLLAFKQMLRVAPTNQTMREKLFKYFLASGHPETAREVADEGLKLDPYNADLYDLKSNACLFLSDFKCAVDALETMYATDSTKADSLFFTKISVAAQEGKDAKRMVKWSQIGAKKYPNNRSLLGYLNAAYALSGQSDSVISVTNRIIAVDSSEAAVEAALAAAKVLIVAPETATTDTSPPGTAPKPTGSDNAPAAAARRDTVIATPASFTPRPKDALPFLEFVIKHGDAQRKEQAAALLYGGAAPLLQEPQDLEGAAELLRLAVQTANPSGKVHPAANYLLGLALLFQVPKIDPLAEKQKSCELARQEETLLLGADSALTAGRSASPDAVDKNLGIIKKYKPRIASMLKAYCKGK